MTPKEIAQRLAQDAEGIARMLLPGGKRAGHEWETGNVDGEAGKSLKVHLTGTKAGVWCDFAAGEGGDLLDLWAQTRGVPIAEAIKQAKAYLGIAAPQFEGSRPKSYKRPEKPAVVAPKSAVRTYLESRGVTAEAIKAYRIAANQAESEIVFPYLRDGELLNVKSLKVERKDGKKVMRLESECELCLFGWQVIPENAREVTICEGEIDALTLWQYGFPALSVPNGATSHVWVENEYPNLERFDTIYLCFDRDEPGEKGAAELTERLGRERCRVVRLPYKDANECLTHGMPKDAMQEIFSCAQTCDPAELKSAHSYADEVVREFYPPEGVTIGFNPPWSRLQGKIVFRPAELILVNGVNGHGKSQVLGHILLDSMESGERACVASMEMKPRLWLQRLVKQATGMKSPSIPYIRKVHDWFNGKLWVFDLVGSAKTERLLEVFRYARKRYGISVFVVDSLMKCGINEDDYNGQKAFVEALCDFKNEFEVTVFLITHSRKGDSESKPSDKMDVKGTGAITDLTDTLLSIWRNKPKEDKAEKGEDVADMPDAVLSCMKQRNGDWEGKTGLWFDRDCYQYLEGSNKRARKYVDGDFKQVAGVGHVEI